MKYTIDATNQKLGRVASEAAKALMGKNLPTYRRHIAPDLKVFINNAAKIKIPESKLISKIYLSYSGYPGGQKSETLGRLLGRRGYVEVFKRVVSGMLPKNKLKNKMIKNLVVVD